VKIKFDRERFWKVFQIAAAVAPTRSPKSILQNVLIKAIGGKCELMATDMEIGVRLHVDDITIETPGQSVVPVDRLSRILQESSDEELTLETNQKATKVEGSRSKIELTTVNPEEFPEVHPFGEENYLTIASTVLRVLIHRTLFATDSDSSRYALGGILLDVDGDTLTAVGTDGRRLAKMAGRISSQGEFKQPTNENTIVPAKSMQIIERILPEDENVEIKLAISGNEMLVGFPQGIIYTRLLEGRYPNWRDALPKTTEAEGIQFQVGPMYQALKQAAVVTSGESRGIDFTFDNGTVVLSNQTADVGSSRVEIPISYDREKMIVRLDHGFVADFLKVLKREWTFTLNLKSSDEAAYCETDDDYGYVIMPLSRDR